MIRMPLQRLIVGEHQQRLSRREPFALRRPRRHPLLEFPGFAAEGAAEDGGKK